MTRTRRIVGVALVLALVGTAAVLAARRRDDRQAQTSVAPDLAARAHAALPASAVPAAVEDQGTVRAAYRKYSSSFLGELTLWLACAGDGRITLVVSGAPYAESGTTEPRELFRAPAECADEPVPARSVLPAYGQMQNLIFDLAGTTGTGGFAYRITSDTGEPLAEGSLDGNPAEALPRTDDGFSVGGYVHAGESFDGGPAPLKGRYTLMGACNGTGTMYLTIGDQKEQMRCSWPPKRHDFRLGKYFTGEERVLTVEYRSTSTAASQYVLNFVPR
jgi:hypothetical protein